MIIYMNPLLYKELIINLLLIIIIIPSYYLI
jgi:hypothetical protein